jgi:hypothetical protein
MTPMVWLLLLPGIIGLGELFSLVVGSVAKIR